jgi:hypothetical protein
MDSACQLTKLVNWKVVREIAHDVRKWAELLYETECNDEWSSDLCGLCGIASAELTTRLQSAGYPAKFILGFGHCWVKLDNKYIDVTATQFFTVEDEVVICNVSKPRKYLHSRILKKPLMEFDDVQEAQDYMELIGWPPGQQPLGYANSMEYYDNDEE